MDRLPLIVIMLSAAGIAAAAAQPPEASAPAAAPAPGRGAALYTRTGCVQCHGALGQGGTEGPPLFATQLDYEAFAAQVREPSDTMPAYTRKILSDADLRAIYNHVQTMR